MDKQAKIRSGPDWKPKKHDAEYWAAQGFLAKPGAFVRKVGKKPEAIKPGDWTQFECWQFSAIVFDALVEAGELVPTDNANRWKRPGRGE